MPDWKSYLSKHLDLPRMRGNREERMLSELADHLEDLYQEARADGAGETEAEASVVRRLGDLDLATDELIRSEPDRGRARMNRWMTERETQLRRRGRIPAAIAARLGELRLTLRALTRRPVFTAVVVLVLTLGIGASTAIFTMVDAIVLSPLPFDQPDRLVSINHSAPARGIANARQCAAWHFTYEEESQVLENIGMYTTDSAPVTGIGEPESVPSLLVTSGLFQTLRVPPVIGRTFTTADEDPDAAATVILGHGYWQTRFAGDPGVIGRTVRIYGTPREIIGVMPPILRSLGQDTAVFVPLRYRKENLFVGNIGMIGVARLKDGVSLHQATADLTRMLPMAWEKFPGGPVASSSDPNQYQVSLQTLKDDLLGPVPYLLWFLLGGVGIVLLIACANVANLLLIRADERESEMAVRASMGASTGRITWEYLKESLLLAALGGLGGLALAFAGLSILIAMGPALPRLDTLSLNPTVLLFTLGISLATGLVVGLLPALKHRRLPLVAALRQGGSRGVTGKPRDWLRNVLVVSEMALALVLLVASGLMVRSFQSLRNVDPGFYDAEEILAIRLYISPREIEDREEMAATHELISRRLAEIPGVSSVGLANSIPMDGSGNVNPFYVDGIDPPGEGPPPIRRHKWIGEGYLETLKIPLVCGRSFTWHDVHERIPAALVSESLAREYWGSAEAALGQRVSARPTPVRWHEVIGVVADVRELGIDQPPPPEVYWPQVTLAFWEGTTEEDVQTWRTMGYAIRSDRIGTPDLLEEVRHAIWSVNPNLPLIGAHALPDLMARSVGRSSFTMVLLAVAAGVALLLGVIGVYGVISYAVSQRRREMGLRLALGAHAIQVKALVLRQGLLLAAIGVAVGLGLALALTRLMTGLLYGVSPFDAVTFLCVAAGLTGVAMIASYLPACRAANVDPIQVLRDE
jgi:predicted permease